METSWLTEKKLVKTGRQEVRPSVTVHTFVLALDTSRRRVDSFSVLRKASDDADEKSAFK